MKPTTAVQELSAIAHELTGIQLSERHVEMIKSRLQRRLGELGLGSLDEYVAYFHDNRSAETPKLIGLLTTHHTYFFREYSHFEYLLEKSLPALREEILSRPNRTLRIWSAACSRGQEVYSLAMFMEFHLKRIIPGANYEILGTDVDAESVATGENGVYLHSELKEVPLSMLGNHWTQGKGSISTFVKANAELRKHCRFKTGNLLAPDAGLPTSEKFDLVFCRNVFIYFNADQIRKISNALIARMEPKGFLFVGISESLTQLKLPVTGQGPSVYRHAALKPMAPPNQVTPSARTEPGVVAINQPIRVLCVDDSSSILLLLKSILKKDQGFEVVGVAENGIEAAKKVKELKPDIVTLDIHMPVQTGIEYLEKNFGPNHPPVVMISSVSRDQSELAGRALNLGASDFVEKPALNVLNQRSEEIKNKLRCAISARRVGDRDTRPAQDLFAKSKSSVDPEKSLRISVFNLSSRKAMIANLKELTDRQPPHILLVEGSKDALMSCSAILSRELGRPILAPDQLPAIVKPGDIILLDFHSQADSLRRLHCVNRRVSICIYGEVSRGGAELISKYSQPQLLLEDLGGGHGTLALTAQAADIVPATSFAYLSSEYFSDKTEKKVA